SFHPCSHYHFMLLRPPISPPVPYTTLFRSRRRGRDVADPRARALYRRVAHRLDGGSPAAAARVSRRVGLALPARVAGFVRALLRDRKSTRLNSSHVKISYAVFCLKKKKLI